VTPASCVNRAAIGTYDIIKFIQCCSLPVTAFKQEKLILTWYNNSNIMYFFLSFRDWSSLQNFGFVYIPCRMLIVIQRFGKHYICRLQRKSILLVGSFWQVYVGQGVIGALVVMQWTGGEEEGLQRLYTNVS
jgi:hypothetical protein